MDQSYLFPSEQEVVLFINQAVEAVAHLILLALPVFLLGTAAMVIAYIFAERYGECGGGCQSETILLCTQGMGFTRFLRSIRLGRRWCPMCGRYTLTRFPLEVVEKTQPEKAVTPAQKDSSNTRGENA